MAVVATYPQGTKKEPDGFRFCSNWARVLNPLPRQFEPHGSASGKFGHSPRSLIEASKSPLHDEHRAGDGGETKADCVTEVGVSGADGGMVISNHGYWEQGHSSTNPTGYQNKVRLISVNWSAYPQSEKERPAWGLSLLSGGGFSPLRLRP
jgi:hypothetical protein